MAPRGTNRFGRRVTWLRVAGTLLRNVDNPLLRAVGAKPANGSRHPSRTDALAAFDPASNRPRHAAAKVALAVASKRA
jgi:hypothetical protein